MTLQENKAVIRRFVEEYQTAGKVEVAEELLGEDFIDHNAWPGMSSGPDGVLQLFAMLRAGFPDLRATIHQQFAEDDKVITYKTFEGTHNGSFLGLPATGRPIKVDVIDIVRVTGGKMREHWNVVDQLNMLRQLGIVQA